MKKYITLCLGIALGGCVASAAPVIAATYQSKKATIVIQMRDMDSGAEVTMVCAPLTRDPAEQSDFK